MSNIKKRKCILCPSHEYEYCGKCKPKEIVETWRFIFDSENCRDIYKILENYKAKKLSAEEAKKQLDKYTIPNLEDMQSVLRELIEDIFDKTRDVYTQNIEETVKSDTDYEEVKPRKRRYTRRNSN